MKKIIAFSVLLALLSAAVFAQDDSGWKIGFAAGLTKNFFYTTKASAEGELTSGSTTGTMKFGDYIKGSSDLFTYTPGDNVPDNRIIVSLSNSGDHHNVYIDVKLDDSWVQTWGGVKFSDLINGDAADWSFSGDTGAIEGPVVFDGKVGTGRYGGFVSANEFWDDWLDLAGYNFFGVETYGGFQPSNNMSTTAVDGNVWGAVYAIGATFGGNIRFAVGNSLGAFTRGFDNPAASASDVEVGFMLSGRNIADILTFDVFYAINGSDKNTVKRGTGKWDNLFGVYLGLGIVENLGLSLGYTAKFTKFETGEDPDGTTVKPYEITDPTWSGVDLKISYNGIEKVGITFNNNVSFASAAGVEVKNPGDPRVNGFDGHPLGKDKNESWFAYDAILGVKLSLSDNLGLTFALGNLMKVYSTDSKYDDGGTSVTLTNDELRVTLHAEYSAGNVTVGLGLNFGLVSASCESESKAGSTTTTITGSLSTVKFSVPLFFKVAI